MDVWPLCVFPALDIDWKLRGVAINGSIPVAGAPGLTRTDGGGFWTCEMSGIWLHTPLQIRAARAWEALLDGGVTNIIVPRREPQFAPRPAGLTMPLSVPHSDGAPFGDGALYVGGLIAAHFVAAATLRATVVTIILTVGSELMGGEVFSVEHPVQGKRQYTIMRVLEQSSGHARIEIRPPLREGVSAGVEVDFNGPGCVMRQTNPEQFLSAIKSGKSADLTASFVEAF